MESLASVGRALVLLGLAIVAIGLILSLVGRVPFLGRLPGDIVYRKGNFTFYVPVATSIVLSLLLTLLLWLFRR